MASSRRLIRVATRKSPLAMRQTELAVAHLGARRPDWEFAWVPMSTTGDERLTWSLERAGGKGLFTSALEQAVLRGEADLAVHSAKDLPTEMPAGLVLAGFLPRAGAGDVLVLRAGVAEPLRLATSSPRRRAQLHALFPQAEWVEVRGNVETRLRKIAEGQADATVMAMAGLHRLGLHGWPGLRFVPLPLARSVPAAGQGAIALQVRLADAPEFSPLLCAETAAAVHLERAVLAALGGGCQSAAAVHWCNGVLHVYHERAGRHRLRLPPDLDWQNAAALRAWLEQCLP